MVATTPKVRWLPPEDEILCHAFVSISEDGTVGVAQYKQTFWERIHEEFMLRGGKREVRNPHALNNHFITIKKSVLVFVNILRTFYQRLESGTNEVDIIEKVRTEYVVQQGKHFVYDHCLRILRKMVKYNPQYNPEAEPDASPTTPTAALRKYTTLRANDDPTTDVFSPEGAGCSSRDRVSIKHELFREVPNPYLIRIGFIDSLGF